MTAEQQPDPPDGYPSHWGYYDDSGHRSSGDEIAASPIANMTSGMGFPVDYNPTDDTAFHSHWGYNRSQTK